MPTSNQKKAMSQGYITKKQYSKLPSKMLDGIIRANNGRGRSRGRASASECVPSGIKICIVSINDRY